MSIEAHARFVGTIPENYDRYLGPVLFEGYARDLARRVPVKERMRLLEVACGTGIVTRHLRARLPESARFVASDLNPPMLDHARLKLKDVPGIEWQPADACVLPFPDASFDVLVCQFGLMFVPDKPTALKEARRALAPGGTFLLSVWDSLEKNVFAKQAHGTVASFFPDNPPTFYETPFSLHRTDELQAMLEDAGFADVRIEALALEGESPAALDLARGLVEGNPIGSGIREQGLDAERVIEAVARVLSREFGDRPIRIPLHAFVVTARS
jgi:ubiquinone/menaquinone biosynthesis C-methylase UbiE